MEIQAGEHFKECRFGLARVDATTVIDHPQLRACFQSPILQHRHIKRKVQRSGLSLRNHEYHLVLSSWGKIDQRGHLKLRCNELPEQLLNVSLRIQEIELVLQGNQRRTELFILDGLGLLESVLHPLIQHLQGRKNPLRADGPPIGGPHILHHAIGHAPPFFLSDHHVVGRLLRPDV